LISFRFHRLIVLQENREKDLAVGPGAGAVWAKAGTAAKRQRKNKRSHRILLYVRAVCADRRNCCARPAPARASFARHVRKGCSAAKHKADDLSAK